jgi:arabinofuranan 3-O-arabinosyltransferase
MSQVTEAGRPAAGRPARRWAQGLRWPRADRPTVACLLALMLLSFLQRPGKVTFDTKLDLAVNPIGFMAGSLHLWNPQSTSGELQNQAYGYLFPMGPFFAVGQALGVPVWLTQRAWSGMLLCLAFGGALLLARALGVGGHPARYVGALAYALAPRMLTEVGTLSAEMLPAALLPWVLLPLVRVGRIGSPRRAAALSALAVLGMGGINGAMVIMSLVLPGIYLLTRRFTRAHLALTGWWCLAVTAAVLWWFLPLLLLGQYSLPFLAYIESAANTTGVVSHLQAVRGANQWVAYVVQGEPWWPAGWMLVDSPVLMVATLAVGALGLVGLALRGLPERHFLVLAVLGGLVLLTVGFVGALDSPLSGQARELLDGPLAPLRNVHKFEPVLRLPLALGFMHAISVAVPNPRRPRLPIAAWLGRWGWAGPALALVAVMAAPAWLLALRPGPGWDGIPAHWRQAAAWLAAQDPDARTLVVPGSGFGYYTWGRTVDEPIHPLAQAPWALRNQVPLGSEGNTRAMDTVEEVLATGRGSPGLADYLARNGYRFLLLRNDLDRGRTQAPPAAVLHQALAGSAGLRLAASFGPRVSPPLTGRSPVDAGEQQPPAIEVYDVGRPVPRARAVLAADVATVSGGPESMLPLLEQGLLGADQPAVLTGDVARDLAVSNAAGTASLVTDGLRRRERNVGLVRDNLSHTLSVDESPRQDRAARDLVPVGGDLSHYTVAVHQGVRSVTASSAASYADAHGAALDPSHLPFAAVDGDPGTAWHSATAGGPRGQWLEVNLGTPREVAEVGVEFVDDLRVGWPVARFRLTTGNGSVDHDVAPAVPGARTYALPAGGLVTAVRVTVLAVRDGHRAGNVGIRELTLSGTRASRALRVPTDATGRVGFAFTRGHHARPACYPTGPVIRCDPRLVRHGEEPHGLDRLFSTRVTGRYQLSATVVPRPGGSVPVSTAQVTAEATSWLAGDPRVAPHAAVDGDPATAWLADIGDRDPRLTVRWSRPRRIDRIRLRFPLRPVASRVTAVELTAGDRTHAVPLSVDGSGEFPEIETDRLVVRIVGIDGHPLDRRGNQAEATAGFAEVELPGLIPARRTTPPEAGFTLPCGSGPGITVDGVALPTSVTGTLGDYLAGRALPLRICDPFDPAADAEALDVVVGEHRLRTEPSAHFLVQDAALRLAGPPPADTRARGVTVARWEPASRTLRVEAGDSAVLVVAENANAGWRATLDGVELRALRVDGWQQAWSLPAGDGGLVTLEFAPDRPYRQGLAVGALTALLVVLLALLPPRGRHAPSSVRLVAGPANGYRIAAGIVVLVAALAGPLAVVLLLAGALVRQLRAGLLAWVVAGGAAIAATVTLTGRLTGHGQAWAYEPGTQAAMLVALCAGVAAAAVPVPGGVDLEDRGLRTPQPGPSRPRPWRGAGLHDQAAEDGEAGGGRGGRGNLPDRAVEPPRDKRHLDPDGEPHHGDGAQVTAGDAGQQQNLRRGEQAPGQREDPQWNRLPAVPRSADQG